MNIVPGTTECRHDVHDHIDQLSSRIMILEDLSNDVKLIKEDIKEVKELLSTWNNIKGFATTMKWIAGFLKVVAIVGSAVGLIWYSLTNGHGIK